MAQPMTTGEQHNFATDDEDLRQILSAAETGNISLLRSTVTEHGAEAIQKTNNSGGNVATFAAANGHVDILQFAMENGVSLHQRAWMGSQPLHFAAGGGHVNVLQFLLDNGIPMDEVNDHGYNAAHEAASGGHIHVLRFLHGTARLPLDFFNARNRKNRTPNTWHVGASCAGAG